MKKKNYIKNDNVSRNRTVPTFSLASGHIKIYEEILVVNSIQPKNNQTQTNEK
jgi:hypothetical protein